ncbi:hypothetical protein HPULCUR_000330 [Helicostylum pulchrum]|uniref:Uncharacterized protein n=1 Tax=Helicostylum pulchrum TaxID=562976 RepID=A0ABP9XKT6_9FUNG
MEDEIIQKIYKLTTELASQQQSNQELATGLTTQITDLKQKAATKYSDNGQEVYIPYPVPPGQRDEVLENLKERLEKAFSDQQKTLNINRELEKECSELQMLVKEYESGLETVANKLRAHASASTEGQIRLRREYEALLNAEKGTTTALFMENTMLQTQLLQLSKSLRDAYQDEGIDVHDEEIAQLKQENRDLLELLKVSKLSDPNIPLTETNSPVLKVARKGVVEDIYCTLLLIALFSSTCYWGQGRCWIDLQQNRLFDVRSDSNATFGQGEGWWNWKITLPIGQ